MSKTMSAAAAKSQFADCLREVEHGQDVVITRYGRPVAVLVDPSELEQLRRLRASSPGEGLAGLVGRYADGEDLSLALDAIVAERGAMRPAAAPDEDPE